MAEKRSRRSDNSPDHDAQETPPALRAGKGSGVIYAPNHPQSPYYDSFMRGGMEAVKEAAKGRR